MLLSEIIRIILVTSFIPVGPPCNQGNLNQWVNVLNIITAFTDVEEQRAHAPLLFL